MSHKRGISINTFLRMKATQSPFKWRQKLRSRSGELSFFQSVSQSVIQVKVTRDNKLRVPTSWSTTSQFRLEPRQTEWSQLLRVSSVWTSLIGNFLFLPPANLLITTERKLRIAEGGVWQIINKIHHFLPFRRQLLPLWVVNDSFSSIPQEKII